MEILLMLRQPLFPADTGGKVRSLNIFSRLAKRASIDAVSFADPLAEAEGISSMRRMFRNYIAVPWDEAAKGSLRFYLEVLANQMSPLPYTLAKCNRPEFRNAVQALTSRSSYDVVLCDFLHTALPLLPISRRPKVIFEHNVEFQLRKRRWELEGHWLRGWILDNEWRKTRRAEAKVCRSFDHVVCVSSEDAQTLRSEFGIDSLSVLPTGVDTDYFRPSGAGSQKGRMSFVGSMDWEPNEDGVVWFLEEVYPRIRRDMPEAEFYIVGRNPSARLRRIAAANPGAVVTGGVADVRPYLAASEVVVVPLRVGGGTRIKIPEAMAMAKPVVSTSVGAEGLPFRNGGELCIADPPEEFAQTVLTLLANGPLRDSISAAARATVVENHGWGRVADAMDTILKQVILGATEPILISGQAAAPEAMA
jgi:sugar transferase (PEP-CTERM/EpsH1 system associated)